ncbi:MAG: acetyl-CoA carboxylase biotin carboxyl carrier protein subunit [Bryobacteraceae bacterium]
MKRDVLANGNPAKLHIEGNRLRYDREGERSVLSDFEITPAEPGTYWVRLGPNSYRVTPGPNGQVSVNGQLLPMEVFDPRDLRTTGRGSSKDGRQEILSPMPGKVIRVLAAVGDTVEEGQGLVVVEAMKMQNEMKSPKAGKVLEVRTKAEATVASGEVLLVIE